MQSLPEFDAEAGGLSFLWLELTNRCNLKCVHCYAESAPDADTPDALTTRDYAGLLESAAKVGCKRVQFIGGEPTMNPALIELITRAKQLGFEFIEVFTNATAISDALLTCFVANGVNVATSFYARDPQVHESVTQKVGSHAATVRNIKRFIAAGLMVRAGIIAMDQNEQCVDDTVHFLKSFGVQNIGIDRVRTFGRAANENESMDQLCGSCWRGSVCVAPNGDVAPCIMSRRWKVGSVRETSLSAIVDSSALRETRRRIYDEVWSKRTPIAPIHRGDGPEPVDCGPACTPNCVPCCNPHCSPNCSPCYPAGKCNPELFCGPCGPGR